VNIRKQRKKIENIAEEMEDLDFGRATGDSSGPLFTFADRPHLRKAGE